MSRPAARLLDGVRGIAFDLDGTLIDTVPDLAAATNHALVAIGAAPLAEHQVAAMVGGGIEVLLERALTCARGARPARDVYERALARFRGYYAQHLFDHSRVFPGVASTLDSLRAEGIKLCCITNKASTFAEPLLAAAGLAARLGRVFSPERPAERKPAPDLLLRACAALQIQPSALLYVGDSRADVGAARAAGCPVAAVDYGYHQGQLDGEFAPDWLISGLAEILVLPAGGPARRRTFEQARSI